jgi:hypothetical protein
VKQGCAGVKMPAEALGRREGREVDEEGARRLGVGTLEQSTGTPEEEIK